MRSYPIEYSGRYCLVDMFIMYNVDYTKPDSRNRFGRMITVQDKASFRFYLTGENK